MGILNRIRQAGAPPSAQEPQSVSGRGHVNGFLQLEELNTDLQSRQGLEIFDRMYRTDADVRQVVNLLANPIAAGTWEVEPAGGSTADKSAMGDAAFIRWALFENMQPTLRGHLFEALPVLFRSGFSPFEQVWEVTDYEGQRVTVPRTLQLRLPRTIYRWKQDRWGSLEAIEQYLPVPRAQVISGPNVAIPGNPVLTGSDGSSVGDPTVVTDTRNPDYRQTVWLSAQNLVYYRVGAEGDNWEGVSLLRPAYKHWLMKDAIERMDAVAQERESLGLPVCYPPLGATSDQLDAMEGVLAGIRTNAQGYVLMAGPKASTSSSGQGFGQGWLLDWLKPGEHGTGRDPQPSLRYHTDKIAAAFIAEFIRLGHSLTGGSRNVAESQSDPFLVGVEAMAGLVEDVINTQLVAPIMAYNRPKAKSPPKVKMSLVDNTTLSQLADFVLKLTQVGAMLPDQSLEDFMRSRADLPPSDPDAVRERGNLDDALRREILMGKTGGGGDPQGTNGPAGSTTGGSAKGTKGTDNRDKAPNPDAGEQNPNTPSSAHDLLTRKAVSASLDVGEAPYMAGSKRVRWREPGYYELNVDLDGIEDHFDSAPDRLHKAAAPHVSRMARGMVEKGSSATAGLHKAIHRVLSDAYDYGQQTVGEEIERNSEGDGYQLKAANRRSAAVISRRASVGTRHVTDSMHLAKENADIAGLSAASQQQAAEKAGHAALKQVARAHVVGAFNLGRQDRTLDDLPDGWGYVYTAILDRNTCEHCRTADDGVVRAPDDPVRVENQPPNPHCASLDSGRGNQCRCFEVPAPLES